MALVKSGRFPSENCESSAFTTTGTAALLRGGRFSWEELCCVSVAITTLVHKALALDCVLGVTSDCARLLAVGSRDTCFCLVCPDGVISLVTTPSLWVAEFCTVRTTRTGLLFSFFGVCPGVSSILSTSEPSSECGGGLPLLLRSVSIGTVTMLSFRVSTTISARTVEIKTSKYC